MGRAKTIPSLSRTSAKQRHFVFTSECSTRRASAHMGCREHKENTLHIVTVTIVRLRLPWLLIIPLFPYLRSIGMLCLC